MKTCRTCATEKLVSEFGRHRGRKDGLQYNCRHCHSAAVRAARKRNPDRCFFTQIKYHYGITRAEWERLYTSQGGACWICSSPFTARPQVDHSHKSGRVRGLLCSPCNIAIGLLKEDPVRLERAVKYLTRVEF